MKPILQIKSLEFQPFLKRIYSVKSHVIFWAIYICYGILYQSMAYPEDENPWYAEAMRYLSFVAIYFGAYYSANNFFENKKGQYFIIIGYFLAGFSLFCILQFVKDYYIFDIKKIFFTNYFLQVQEIFLVSIFAIFFSIFEFTNRLNHSIVAKLKLKNVNTIYENRTRRNKEILIRFLDKTIAEAGPNEAVADLVEFKILVDFLINNTHKSLIPIALEIENLLRYIKLYQLRSGKTDTFIFTVTGKIVDWQIPHKTILTLVENTIKHGNLDQAITINIDSQPTSLKITVKNTISKVPSLIESTNIGLSNLMDRLELHLKNRHKIDVLKQDECFEVCIWVFKNSLK